MTSPVAAWFPVAASAEWWDGVRYIPVHPEGVIGVNREAMGDRLLGRTQVKTEESAALAAFLELDVGEFFPGAAPAVTRA